MGGAVSSASSRPTTSVAGRQPAPATSAMTKERTASRRRRRPLADRVLIDSPDSRVPCPFHFHNSLRRLADHARIGNSPNSAERLFTFPANKAAFRSFRAFSVGGMCVAGGIVVSTRLPDRSSQARGRGDQRFLHQLTRWVLRTARLRAPATQPMRGVARERRGTSCAPHSVGSGGS